MRTNVAVCVAVVLSHAPAWAEECDHPTPECHLANGKKLLESDPTRAAGELLASYRLDERTETLTLYATALARDHRYARALETWQRIILFREAEIESAREAMRHTRKKPKLAAARAKEAAAQEASEQAAAEIMKLWPNVARAQVRVPVGEAWVVTADGVELDISKEVLVNAGHDELTFVRRDGSSERVVVEAAAGSLAVVEAPVARARPEQPAVVLAPRPKPRPPSVIETPRPTIAAVAAPRSPRIARIGVGLGVIGVVGLGVAGTLGYLSSRDFDRAKQLGCDADGQCPVGPAADLGEQAHDRARWAQISAIGGGALAITGATMWALGRGKWSWK